jgi:hypothetical protein
MAQDLANSIQNSTASNITQLATILPTIDQPITPTSFIPISEVTDDSDDSSSDNADDDNGDGDGGGSSAFAGGGGAFAG